MSNTLGMPSMTPSNATGRSGVGAEQVGHLGQGILGTIEEGVGGTSVKTFYYGTGSAFFQAPSTQRSVGDDIRSFNVKQFNTRGMVNVPRKWMNYGPTQLFFTYPINYAWAGPEYYARIVPRNAMHFDAFQRQGGVILSGSAVNSNSIFKSTVTNVAANASALAKDGFEFGGTVGAGDTLAGPLIRDKAGDLATEVRSGPNILPTYFWSGGVGFAALSMIEMNMGGGGNIIFDRYANFALIMASTPTISMREHLMRMAGGGLYYDHDTDYNALPVKFGYVLGLTDEGLAPNRTDVSGTAAEMMENTNMIWAPVEWQIQVPLKTPETNFWQSLMARKPLDTSCFASDLQYTILFGNFFEFSDTGVGLANCPFYMKPTAGPVLPSELVSEFSRVGTAGGVGTTTVMPYWHPHQTYCSTSYSPVANVHYRQCDGWWSEYLTSAAPADLAIPAFNSTRASPAGVLCSALLWGTTAGNTLDTGLIWPPYLPQGYFYTGFAPSSDKCLTYGQTDNAGNNIAGTADVAMPRNRIGSNPRIWNNHYRVCNGSMYAGYGVHRPKMAMRDAPGGKVESRYMYDVNTLSGGAPAKISYASGFTRAEWRNQSLKLTNPALSARLPLQSTPSACVYYPFTYAFAQTYRIPASSNPFDASNIHRFCSNQILVGSSGYSNQTFVSVLTDTLAVSNRIVQNIQMPANPVTSMIIGIYREKDRRYLGQNTQGSYSPVLFWNALNPLRATLYDGGNILFDYAGSTSFLYSSLIDRPDVLKIPFRGGLCQQDPRNILPSPYELGAAVGSTYPDGFGKPYGGFRFARNASGGQHHGHRYTPIHCTEWYNCHLLEFPFCMYAPLCREGSVQSTPSFAKTILRLEFFLDPLLKPHRGLDDMYDLTTQVPTTWISCEPTQIAAATYGPSVANGGGMLMPARFGGGTTAANANINLSVPSAHILDSVMNFNGYADEREPVIYPPVFSALSANKATTLQVARSATAIANPNPTMSPNASSWNINDGALLIHVTFCQNQVWVISPLRTTILSSRG